MNAQTILTLISRHKEDRLRTGWMVHLYFAGGDDFYVEIKDLTL